VRVSIFPGEREFGLGSTTSKYKRVGGGNRRRGLINKEEGDDHSTKQLGEGKGGNSKGKKRAGRW